MIQKAIHTAVKLWRTTLLVFVFLWIIGGSAFLSMPKERYPDINIPLIFVVIPYKGISPEDSERLLLRPMEKHLKGISGLKEMTSRAFDGVGEITLEFAAGFDSDKALIDVRDRVDQGKPDLPSEADEPLVKEINLSLFPILSVILSGDIPERTLLSISKNLRDKIESLPSVLSVSIGGDREEVLEITVDPLQFETYGLEIDKISRLVRSNNQIITAGSIDSGHGKFSVKVPGLFYRVDDVADMPVKASGDSIVRAKDIATVKRTFSDRDSYAYINGKSAIALDVSKRLGENVLDTIKEVRELVATEQANWPDTLQVTFTQDTSKSIKEMLGDLENNLVFAILLVVIVIVLTMGVRSAIFIAISIPASFLIGIVILSFLDLTMNIVVLFSLILSVGILVDSAIVVCEYADRQIKEGIHYKQAYTNAATRMALPIITSTMTTIVVFLPLLFWPGTVGEFMRFMPITLIATLSGSLISALIFLPVIGSLFGKESLKENVSHVFFRKLSVSYRRGLVYALDHPKKFLIGFSGLLLAIILGYGLFGKGVEFFPEVEPSNVEVIVRARGNLSIEEQNAIVREVEQHVLVLSDDVLSVYTNVGQSGKDVIGRIRIELADWRKRRKAEIILEDIRARTASIPGIIIETQVEGRGPAQGKPIEILITSHDPSKLPTTVTKITEAMKRIGGFVDIDDGKPIPSIEWRVDVNRELAAKFDVNITSVGEAIKLVTRGITMAAYRSNDSNDEIDIIVRFPKEHRVASELDGLRVNTPNGSMPVSNFITKTPQQKVDVIERHNSLRKLSIAANVLPGVLPDSQLNQLQTWLKGEAIDPDVTITFQGEREDQQETSSFLAKAFLLALFGMAIILVTQFNSLFDMFVILSAVFLATVGVLFGLMVTLRPFGVVMSGVGIITLAGIIVNNNIILIDTFKKQIAKSSSIKEAILVTGEKRLRPILLTVTTTVLGLVPMVFGLNINFIERYVAIGSPSTQWWKPLSTAIAGGLTFATILTLFVTPCVLYLWYRRHEINQRN